MRPSPCQVSRQTMAIAFFYIGLQGMIFGSSKIGAELDVLNGGIHSEERPARSQRPRTRKGLIRVDGIHHAIGARADISDSRHYVRAQLAFDREVPVVDGRGLQRAPVSLAPVG